jgi:hypothetical protein
MIRTPEQWERAIAHNRALTAGYDLSGAIQITKGRYFWPLEPQHPANDVDIEFIAHILAGERRWGGIIEDAYGNPCDYSVAQHCVHVADIVNLNRDVLIPEVNWAWHASPAMYGLMHDASEAYLKDFPRPVKVLMNQYYPAEELLMERILSEFDVPVGPEVRAVVRMVDNMMIFMERDKLIGQPVNPYSNENEHPGVTMDELVPDFRVWSPAEAKRKFLDKFAEIEANDGNLVPLNYANRGFKLAA